MNATCQFNHNDNVFNMDILSFLHVDIFISDCSSLIFFILLNVQCLLFFIGDALYLRSQNTQLKKPMPQNNNMMDTKKINCCPIVVFFVHFCLKNITHKYMDTTRHCNYSDT
eukprot:852130_1